MGTYYFFINDETEEFVNPNDIGTIKYPKGMNVKWYNIFDVPPVYMSVYLWLMSSRVGAVASTEDDTICCWRITHDAIVTTYDVKESLQYENVTREVIDEINESMAHHKDFDKLVYIDWEKEFKKK
jgi:hypothetical protein